MAVPEDTNVPQKDAEKKLKYKSLCTKIQRKRNMKYVIKPELIGTSVIVTQNLQKTWKTYQKKRSTDLQQKTAIIGTSHIIRKVPQPKT